MSVGHAIARNTITQTVGKVTGTILGLVAISLITRYLGQTGFGQYTTIMTFLQFFGILVDFGLTLVTVQMISKPGVNEEKTLANILTFRAISAFFFLGLAPITVLLFPYDASIKSGVAIAAASFFFIAINQVLTGLFQKRIQMSWVAAAEIINRVILLGLTWYAVRQNLGLHAVLLAIVVSNLIQFLILFFASFKFVRIRPAFDKEIWKEILALSWPIAISIGLNLIYLKTDTLILSLVGSQADVGIYGAAYKVVDVLVTIPIMFAGLVLPLLTKAWAENDKIGYQRMIQRSFDAISLLTLPLLIGTWLLSREIMVLIAGRDFAISGEVLNILIIAICIIYIGSLFGHAIISLNKQKATIWAYGLSAALSLIGYFIFIPLYLYYGAAWMTVFSEAMVTLSIIYVFYRTTKFFPTLKIWIKAGLATLIMAGYIYLTKPVEFTPWENLNIIIVIATAAAVYFASLIFTKAITIRFLKQIISPRTPA